MTGHFPQIYGDELLYSAIARYCSRMRLSSKKTALIEVIGKSNRLAVIDLPSNLDAFIAGCPSRKQFTAEALIYHHTLFPLYAQFQPAGRREELIADMRSAGGKRVHLRIGAMAGRVQPPEWLRCCPVCDIEDAKRLGTTYWHRLHQIAGVEVCPLHKVFLENSDAPRGNRQTRHEFCDSAHSKRPDTPRRVSLRTPGHRTLLNIARRAECLLNQKNFRSDPEQIRMLYAALLYEKGLATCNGRVQIQELIRSFEAWLPATSLILLAIGGTTAKWIAKIVRKPRNVQSPIKHLLLMEFLGSNVDGLFIGTAQNDDSHISSYWCLNPVCERHGQKCIRGCTVKHNKEIRGSVGVIVCPDCGCIYCKVLRSEFAEKIGTTWIRSYGGMWERHLVERWHDPLISLRQIGRELGVDPTTAKRHAARLGLAFPRMGKRQTRVGKAIYERKRNGQRLKYEFQSQRGLWASARAKNPAEGPMKLRGRFPALYAWLYRHDRQWLWRNMPARKKFVLKPKPIWERRDHELAPRISGAALDIRSGTGKPVRVSPARIGRKLKVLPFIEKHLQKMPMTAKALEAAVESREDFAIRRIWWVAAKLRRRGDNPPLWQMIRQAGCRNDLMANRRVRHAFRKAQVSLQDAFA